MKASPKLLRSSTIAWCALALGATGALAGNTSKPREERGTITEVDASQHQLVVSDHKHKAIHRYQWNDKTEFTERGKSVTASMIKVGENARLTYTSAGELPTVQRVTLAPAKGHNRHSDPQTPTHQS